MNINLNDRKVAPNLQRVNAFKFLYYEVTVPLWPWSVYIEEQSQQEYNPRSQTSHEFNSIYRMSASTVCPVVHVCQLRLP